MSLRRRILAAVIAVNLLVIAALAVLLSLDSLERDRREKAARDELLKQASSDFREVFGGSLGLLLRPETPVRELLSWGGWSLLEDAQVMKREHDARIQTVYLNPLGARSHGLAFRAGVVREALDRAILGRSEVFVGEGVAFPVYTGGRQELGVWGSVYAVPRLGRGLPGAPPVRIAESLGTLALGMALLIGATYVLLSRLVLRPIETLSGAMRRVARGDLEATVPLSGRGDEIDTLGRAFNRMAAELRAYRDDMEGRVRTALEKAQAAERHLVIAQRLAATGKLASGIAHEINNPLGGMINVTRALQAREQPPGKQKEYLDLILGGLERIEAIVRKVLQFSPRRVRPQLLELGPVVERALALVEHRVARGRIALERRLPARGLRVFGDPGELQQVFLNLLLNAVDAVPPGGWIRVAGEGGADHVRVCVADGGCGMTDEERAQLFDAFYTTKPAGEGTGLGLFICYSIVAGHGGRLEVESRKGEGSVFTVILPRPEEAGASGPP